MEIAVEKAKKTGIAQLIVDQGQRLHLKQVTEADQRGHLNGGAGGRPGRIDDGVPGLAHTP